MSLKPNNKSYINGKWIAEFEETFPVTNPATGETIVNVYNSGVQVARQAVEAAANALDGWKSKTAKARQTIMNAWFEHIIANKESLAHLITQESGKTLAESRAEIGYGASFIPWFAEEGKRTYGDVIPTYSENNRVMAIRQPVGVVAAITPWNFPLAMITRKVAPALAAGCTVIVRPSELTPLTALALAELAHQAGIPAGVLNIIATQEPDPVGKFLCEDKKIRKLSFTGSTRVGRLLSAQCAPQLKKLSMELGGNAPFIVFADANIPGAVKGAMGAKFRNGGQSCICANRFIVHESVHDEFVRKLKTEIAQLKTGNGMDNDVHLGPLINEKAVEKVTRLIDDARKKGAEVILGGTHKDKRWIEPTLIINADESMDIFHEEIFGPVAVIYKFKDDLEAIEMANNTEYGLAAYLYTESLTRSWKVSEALEYGMIGINEGLISTEIAPFGGIKQSGMGREGSKYGIEAYMELKYLNVGGLK